MAFTLSCGTNVLVDIEDLNRTPFSSIPVMTEEITSPLRRNRARRSWSDGFDGDSARAWANWIASPPTPPRPARGLAAAVAWVGRGGGSL